MGTKIKAPPARDYGKETYDTLQTQINLAPDLYAAEEKFRGKATGNKILSKNCTFCEFRFSCWSSLVEKPQIMSKAREPKTIGYVYEKGKENTV